MDGSIDFGTIFNKTVDAVGSWMDRQFFEDNPQAASAYFASLAGGGTPQRSEPSNGAATRTTSAPMAIPSWVWPVGAGVIALAVLKK